MPVLVVAERDYTAVYDKMTTIGPLLEKVGMLTKGVAYDVKREMDILRNRNGVAHGGVGDGQPKVETDVQMADAILHLAGRLQRSPRDAGLPVPGEADRHRARRPGRRARGQADHLRRHPGRTGAR